MVTDTGLIVVSIISLAGMVLLFTLNNNNWFRRENFKIQKSNVLNENRIKMKKLEKDLGITSSKTQNTHETGGVLDLIKGLDSDKVGQILDLVKGEGGDMAYDDAPKSDIAAIIDKLPPSVIEGFLSKLQDNTSGKEGGGY
jgi:hypothetical protein